MKSNEDIIRGFIASVWKTGQHPNENLAGQRAVRILDAIAHYLDGDCIHGFLQVDGNHLVCTLCGHASIRR